MSQFESVAVDDIVAVEQALLDEGMPLVEVQLACDLHSALFHGHNEGEVCAMGEESDVPAGHPVDVLRRENRALERCPTMASSACPEAISRWRSSRGSSPCCPWTSPSQR